MWFALRGKRHLDFKIASNMKLANGFNDVVLASVDWEDRKHLTWHFVRVTQTSKKKIEKNDLESTRKNAPFSMSNRFSEYVAIKKKELFAESTHIFSQVTDCVSDLHEMHVNVCNVECVIRLVQLSSEDFLYFERGNNKPVAPKKYMLERKSSGGKELEFFSVFLEEFFLVTDYPDEKELERLFEKELCPNEKNDTSANFENTVYLVSGGFQWETLKFQSSSKYYTKNDLEKFMERASVFNAIAQ